MPEKEINIVSEDIPNSLFKRALDAAADGVVITDVYGNIIWVNPAYEILTGYMLQDVKGNNPRLLKSGRQDPAFYEDLWSTIKSGNVWKGELWNRRKDGTLYLEEQSITPVDENGVITHFIAIKRDISKQHKLQNQLNMTQRIEAIGSLTAGVAHNFNNKLASILGYAELSIEEAEKYSNDDLSDYLNEISIAGKLARDLVRQMMSFSRNEVHKSESVDVSELAKESIKILSSSLPSAIQLHSRFEDVPNISVDTVMFHQIMLTLVANSSDAMNGKGVITIGLNKQNFSDVECGSCHETINGDYVVLSVQDTGHGINNKDINNIFLPFFTTREMSGGIGMGLSALHGMLHEQQGHVLVESEINQGTEFRLLFPVIEDETVDKVDADSNLISNVSNISIMLVDDEVSVANVLAEILRHYDYKVTVETDSKSALVNLSEKPDAYDLVITDKDMPNLSGIELAEQISEINQEIPVILITGYDANSVGNNNQYIKSVLSKPFETTDLINSIKNLL